MQQPLSVGSISTIPLVGRTRKVVENAAGLAIALMLLPCLSGAETTRIPPQELRRMQLNQETDYVLIDVRLPVVFEEGHIGGALNVPLETVSRWQPPKVNKIVVYCPSNTCPTGEQAAGILEDRGIAGILLLDEGYAGWTKQGYPVVRAKKAAPSLTLYAANNFSRNLIANSCCISAEEPASGA